MDVKGQGALEYLLLIGGAVLVAAIVIALITGIPTGDHGPECSAACANRTATAMADVDICEDFTVDAATTALCSGSCEMSTATGCYYDPSGIVG